jgi:hypothetical protein
MCAAGLFVATLALPATALAALGGDVTSVQADSVRMRGAVTRIGQTESYGVHEIRAATGTIVREYVGPTGTVFAVAWEGPWLPDMRQLLGTYFDRFAAAARAAQVNRSGHRPLLVQEGGLVVQMGGHPRAFAGKAYVGQLLPQGVRAESIR